MAPPRNLVRAGTALAFASAAVASFVPKFFPAPAPALAASGPPRVIAWNDLGMHCIDPDFSIFSILPPYNTIDAQFMTGGQLVSATAGPYTVTYEAVADAHGSFNSTSIGKTNFWDHVQDLFGVVLPPDMGLAGNAMPGAANTPQPMHPSATWNWHSGEGIPLTPYDDTLTKNPYPMLRVVVRNGAGTEVASTVTVAPVSGELSCNRCHASGMNPAARPAGGWMYDADPLRDDRLNILALHDRHLGEAKYDDALASTGIGASGMLARAQSGHPILCAACHGSNALPGTGIAGIEPMTEAMHKLHGTAHDETGTVLDDNPSRTACYLCHPGTETQCLRGAMGRAIGPDGDFAMQCQSCHGDMAKVGEPGRDGWFDEPECSNCHTGSATHNNGQIRFTDVFEPNGDRRVAVDALFTSDADTPVASYSLYRFSTGHGELQCAACHGSPHAILPTGWENDNVQSIQLQGHIGTISECATCHSGLEDEDLLSGPHGMHPSTAAWANGKHGDFAEHGVADCRMCHGANDRGTVLSLAQSERSYTNEFGTRTYERGNLVSCYDCHNGPDGENSPNNARPVAQDQARQTPTDVALPVTLVATDANGNPLTYRIVRQPDHGSVAFAGGTSATYRARNGYVGVDSFDFAAFDGKTDSNVATVTIQVGARSCAGKIENYGFPCVGSNGSMPRLDVTGCPTPGGQIQFHFEGFWGGSAGVLGLGFAKGNLEFAPDCTLLLDQIYFDWLPVISFGGGTGAGNGSASLTVNLPAWLNPNTFYFQAFGYNPDTTWPFPGSNAVAVTIQ
ncbi:MAG: Ig-like domain-containing protein [Planctomycetota bacterium]